MPNIRSAMKHVRSDAKKRERNQTVISELKTLHQKLVGLTQNPEEAKKLSLQVVSKYDKAVSRGIIPRGRADRKKARIAQFLKQIKKK